MGELLNFTLNASSINMSYPYGIEDIINKTAHGNLVAVITDTNTIMSGWPVRLLCYGLFVVFFGLGRTFRPQASQTKIAAVAAILAAVLVGIFSMGGLINIAEAVPFIVIAAIGAYVSKGE